MQPEQQQPQQQPYQYPAYPAAAQQQDPNKLKRIIIVVAAFFFVLIGGVIVFALFFTTPSIKSELGNVAAAHQEIARVTAVGLNADRSAQEVRNVAANMQAVSAGHVRAMEDYVDANYELGLTSAKLKSDETKSLDDSLESAEQNNNFDPEFLDTLELLLNNADKELTTAEAAADTEEVEAIIRGMQGNNAVLRTQLEQLL